MRKSLLVTALAAFSLVGTAWADVLVMRDGTQREGTLVSASGRTITFEDQNGVRHRYNVSDVQSLDFSNTQTGYYNQRQAGNAANASSAARVIPAGTDLQIRTNEAINSQTAAEGQTFSGTVAQDVLDANGNVIVPRGSNAQLVIRQVSTGGATSSPELVLDLESISVGGRRYLVSTPEVTQRGREGLGANRRTGEYVGGGAVLGTIIGALGGGGKGAAIGALAGAAAGAGVQVLTRGKEVKVPAETVLDFQLQQPVELTPAA